MHHDTTSTTMHQTSCATSIAFSRDKGSHRIWADCVELLSWQHIHIEHLASFGSPYFRHLVLSYTCTHFLHIPCTMPVMESCMRVRSVTVAMASDPTLHSATHECLLGTAAPSVSQIGVQCEKPCIYPLSLEPPNCRCVP